MTKSETPSTSPKQPHPVRAPERLVRIERSISSSGRIDVAEKAAVSRGIFFAARELTRREVYGAPLEGLLARAGEAIDDIDTVLIGLDPVHDAPTFAIAAGLQRQLEQLQASMTERRRRGAIA